MALNIKLNFDNCYKITESQDDLKLQKFNTILKNGEQLTLGISISEKSHSFLPEVYNMAFGPIDENNKINDKVKITHENVSRLFSTIVLSALSFLNEHPDTYLGIDGSNNARAYLYYRCIINNHHYLTQYFTILGIKYYVRVLRKLNDDDFENPIDEDDMTVIPVPMMPDALISSDKLYNYIIFKLITH